MYSSVCMILYTYQCGTVIIIIVGTVITIIVGTVITYVPSLSSMKSLTPPKSGESTPSAFVFEKTDTLTDSLASTMLSSSRRIDAFTSDWSG